MRDVDDAARRRPPPCDEEDRPDAVRVAQDVPRPTEWSRSDVPELSAFHDAARAAQHPAQARFEPQQPEKIAGGLSLPASRSRRCDARAEGGPPLFAVAFLFCGKSAAASRDAGAS
jgi:hypothetical protein